MICICHNESFIFMPVLSSCILSVNYPHREYSTLTFIWSLRIIAVNINFSLIIIGKEHLTDANSKKN